MTIATQHIQFDRWLICSESAFRSLSGHWRAETGQCSLLDWRLAKQLIEHVPPGDLSKRLQTLSSDRDWAINIVVDEADVELLNELEDHSDDVDIHLIEWRESPISAVLAMNAPDSNLLKALHDPEDNSIWDVGVASPIDDHEGYLSALKAWESDCRANQGIAFADQLPAYANSPIPWAAFLSGDERSAESPDAANDNWIELVRLAAATSGEHLKAISLEDPRHTPARWTLTLSPIDGGPMTVVIFRVNEAAIPAFQGCKIKLRVSREIIDLGQIDEEGQAEIVLASPVEMQGLAISLDGGE